MHRPVLVALIAFAFGLVPASVLADGPATSIATFEGRQIDLSKGWGDAQACVVQARRIECVRNRAGLWALEQQLVAERAASPDALAASCSTPLRLFADPSYGGRELVFYDRGYWQNLSTWSFGNQLSSYRVGACGVYLADLADGGGSWYPGNTSAGHSQPSMLSGWNDRISSIFIQ